MKTKAIVLSLIPLLAIAACSSQADKKKYEMAQDHVSRLNKAADFFFIEKKKCPETANDLAYLFTGTDENAYDFSTDPWGNAFIMYPIEKGCHFKSLGADGKDGGEDLNADIQ